MLKVTGNIPKYYEKELEKSMKVLEDYDNGTLVKDQERLKKIYAMIDQNKKTYDNDKKRT